MTEIPRGTGANDRLTRQVFNPIDRLTELLIGLLIVTTFTRTLNALTAGHSRIGLMLLGALGCNFAWATIASALYLSGVITSRAREARLFESFCTAQDCERRKQIWNDAVPHPYSAALDAAELEVAWQRVTAHPITPVNSKKDDIRSAFVVGLLIFCSAFPVAVPFLFLQDLSLALLFSNTVSLAMLFGIGIALGYLTGHKPFRLGVAFTLVGVVPVLISLAL